MNSSTLSLSLRSSVKELYERYPYPHYPLFAKPLWQDGYLGSSEFIGRLLYDLKEETASIFSNPSPQTLIAGCGEILPYILRHFEPEHHLVYALDFSKRSLQRAQFRLWGHRKSTVFIHEDILDFCERSVLRFDHIDLYGVLHHLPNPTLALKQVSNTLLRPGGTMRVMVYNSKAREWIHDIAKIFVTLNLSLFHKNDLKYARLLLDEIKKTHPQLQLKLNALGSAMIANDARLVDTFFHTREAKLSMSQWFEAFETAQLSPFAAFDRFCEWDHSPNPLWKLPRIEEFIHETEQFQFENNLEVYLYKAGAHKTQLKNNKKNGFYRSLKFKSPPPSWFRFIETANIPFWKRWRLWWAFIDYLETGLFSIGYQSFLGKDFSLETLKRLARIGAILPGMLDSEWKKNLTRPLHLKEQSEAPSSCLKSDSTPVLELAAHILKEKNCYHEKKIHLIDLRLSKAEGSKSGR